MKMPWRVLALAVACGWLLPNLASAQEWTRFRGPNGTGISDAKNIPTKFSVEDANWRIKLPGIGHSQPVLWGEKIFLLTAVDEGTTRTVVCLSAKDGSELWKKAFPATTHHKHKYNSYASATPAVDEKQVYVAFSTPQSYKLVALDHAGNQKWLYDLGPFVSQHSDGISPVVFEDMVILGNEQDGESFLLAVNRNTGKPVWKTPRRSSKAAYSTPCVYRPENGNPQLIFNSQSYGVSAVDAYTGKPIWEAPLFDKRSCSSPVVAGGHIFGTCGSGGGGNYLIAIKPGGQGDVSQTHLSFKLDKSSMIPYVPSPLVYEGLLYLWSDKGIVSCVKPENGQLVWQQRVGGNFFGSPVCVDGKIYCLSADGDCVVLAAGPKYRLLAKNDIGEGSHCTPAIAGGRMYIRTFTHLMSFGK